jgi:AcrR family transcriptional regulator
MTNIQTQSRERRQIASKHGAPPAWVHTSPLARTARGERTRQKVVQAAETLFKNASNYENIGVADIARTSKTSIGTIYRYFDSKEDLLHLVLSNAFWRMFTASRGTWRAQDTAAVNIERTTRAYLEAFWEERSFLGLARRLAATSEGVRDTWWSMKREIRERMRARLEQDQEAAGVPALDPEIMIRCLFGMVDDYAERAFINEEYGPASKEDIPQVAFVIAQLWYRAVWANPGG